MPPPRTAGVAALRRLFDELGEALQGSSGRLHAESEDWDDASVTERSWRSLSWWIIRANTKRRRVRGNERNTRLRRTKSGKSQGNPRVPLQDQKEAVRQATSRRDELAIRM